MGAVTATVVGVGAASEGRDICSSHSGRQCDSSDSVITTVPGANATSTTVTQCVPWTVAATPWSCDAATDGAAHCHTRRMLHWRGGAACAASCFVAKQRRSFALVCQRTMHGTRAMASWTTAVPQRVALASCAARVVCRERCHQRGSHHGTRPPRRCCCPSTLAPCWRCWTTRACHSWSHGVDSDSVAVDAVSGWWSAGAQQPSRRVSTHVAVTAAAPCRSAAFAVVVAAAAAACDCGCYSCCYSSCSCSCCTASCVGAVSRSRRHHDRR
jgi:hypothetical protein